MLASSYIYNLITYK